MASPDDSVEREGLGSTQGIIPWVGHSFLTKDEGKFQTSDIRIEYCSTSQ